MSHIVNLDQSQHPNIKFTCENEAENQLNFLDVTVHRKDNKFETSVYRKPTFTGLGSIYIYLSITISNRYKLVYY